MRNMFNSGKFASLEDRDRCARMIRQGSRSFFTASMLLPREVREAAYSVYAFCRYSDDVVDIGDCDARAVDRLYDRLDAAYTGAPANSPVDRAFADVVLRYGVPKALPAALLEGLSWDVEGRRYDTFDDLLEYAVRVAGTVGAIMSVLMGARSEAAIARASDLGVAMQLTNIARDIGEDARGGRVYAPLDWFQAARLDVSQWLRAPDASVAVRAMTKRLLDAADCYYGNGRAGIPLLPRDCRAAISAAAYIYADIGRVIAENDFDSVTQRAVTPFRRKLGLLAEALAALQRSEAQTDAPPLDAAQFLVAAVASAPMDAVAPAARGASFGSVIDLLMRLEKRDRAMAGVMQ